MDTKASPPIPMGTCSWNYDSWIGLVYSRKADYSAAYLNEYATKYPTVEVDSWFYRLPSPEDAFDYASRVPEGFSFACKVTESISLTHGRSRDRSAPLVPNDGFLSPGLFASYLEGIEPLKSRIFLLELEFEYLNRQKMPSQKDFMNRLEVFFAAIDRSVPLGIECRNANYLNRDWFGFLKDQGIAPVLSEKIYLPRLYELYDEVGDLIGDRVAVRLLGGDRKEIEAKTKGMWNEIVEPKQDLNNVAAVIAELSKASRLVQVYVNNHYEGSAPKTIERLEALL